MKIYFTLACLTLSTALSFGSLKFSKPSEDKPDMLYVFSADLLTDSYTNNITTDNGGGLDQGQTWYHEDHQWQYATGGSGFRQFSGQSDDWLGETLLWSEDYSFPWYTTWDTNFLGTEIINVPGYFYTNSVGLPFSVGEFCLVNDPRSPAPVAQNFGGDAWITNIVSEQYSRSAFTRWHLQTGGKSGRSSLWHLTATATEVLDKRAVPPDIGTNSRAIPPQRIIISGLAPDASGNLWTVLPDNADIDVTPFAAGKRFYTFDLANQKYTPYIDANGINTATEPSGFCVGQKIVLKPQFDPPLPAGLLQTNQCNWWLPPKYVNAYEQYDPFFANYFTTTCDPVQVFPGLGQGFDSPTGPIYCKAYTNLDWPLHQPETGAWWISGGDKSISCRSKLVLTNGLTLPLLFRGNFSMYRPSITTFTPGTNMLLVIDTNSPPDIRVGLGDDAQGGAAFDFAVTASASFRGTYFFTQLVDRYFHWDRSVWYGAVPETSTTQGAYYLDNVEVYSAATILNTSAMHDPPPVVSLIFGDAPRLEDTLATYADLMDHFKTYVRFQPNTPGSIPVTLGRVDWMWHGLATLSSGGWSGTLATNITAYLDDDSPVNYVQVFINN